MPPGNDIGHHRGAVQAEKLEHAVGNIGHTRHVAAVFHNGDERKHDKHQRHKTEHPANARDHAVNQQGGEQAFGSVPLTAPASALNAPSSQPCG